MLFDSTFATTIKAKIWALRLRDAPSDEQDAAFAMRVSLLGLVALVEDFRAALSLFEHCAFLAAVNPLRPDYLQWQRIAIRDGGIILEQYSKAMKIPVPNKPWLASVRRKELGKARSDFDAEFPLIERVRHSMLHRSEMVASSERIGKNSTKTQQSWQDFKVGGEGFSIMLPDTYLGNRYCALHEGKMVGYALSAKSLETVKSVTERVIGAFSALGSGP